MSQPEMLLVLARAGTRRARELLVDTHSRHLASAAKWSKEAAKAFARFGDTLRAELGELPAAPARPSRAQVAAAFASLGIPAQPPG